MFHRTFVSIVITIGAIGFLASALRGGTQADAYQLLGVKFDHTAITHHGALDAYVSRALQEWGQFSAITDGGSGTDISLGMTNLQGSAQAETVHRPGQPCGIVVDQANWDVRTEFERQVIVTHEVGHCLGLAHSFTGTLMTSNDGTPVPERVMFPLSCDDAAGIAALYPRAKGTAGCIPPAIVTPRPTYTPTNTPTPTPVTPTPAIGFPTLPPTAPKPSVSTTATATATATPKLLFRYVAPGLSIDSR